MTSLFEIYVLSVVTIATWFTLVWWNSRGTEK